MITECRGLKIIPFHPDHFQGMNHGPDPGFEDVMPNENNLAFSVKSESNFIFCAGLSIMFPGVAHVWLIASDLIKKYPIAASIICFRGLYDLCVENNIHRVQTVIYPHFTAGIRFIEWLGFTREGTMRKYTLDKKDYYLYAKIM